MIEHTRVIKRTVNTSNYLLSGMASLMDYDAPTTTSSSSRTLEDYDTNFAAEISSKMRVPHRITTHDSPDSYNIPRNYREDDAWTNQKSVASMNIPHRLVMNDLPTGQNDRSHSSDRVNLVTPPHTLTLDERAYPVVDDYREDEYNLEDRLNSNCNNNNIGNRFQTHDRRNKYTSQEGSIISNEPQVNDLSTSLLEPEGIDDLDKTRRQVARLIRHVRHLERENSRRVSRELLLYPVVISYFIYKATKWFMKQF